MPVSLLRVALLFTLASLAVFGQENPSAGTPVQLLVTVEGRHNESIPPITQKDVMVYSGKDRLEVLDWTPAQGERAALQLMLLMDDSSTTEIGTQFEDIKKFVRGLGPDTSVAVGYMRNGTIDLVQDFTTDHAAAAGKLRLPLGMFGANASPYFSLSDVLTHWSSSNSRRQVLMITDGIDRFYGDGPDNPYVDTAIRDAQKTGIPVSSIYWKGVGHFGHNYWHLNWGQNYLSQIADGTGGEAYWQGFGNPVSFSPFFDDFSQRLNHQYFVTFRAKPRNKAGAERVRVRTELPKVELTAASEVWVPATR